MSVFEQKRVAPFGAISIFSIVDAVEQAGAMIRAKIVAERTHSALSKLSPRTLQDIGLADTDLAEFSQKIARRSV